MLRRRIVAHLAALLIEINAGRPSRHPAPHEANPSKAEGSMPGIGHAPLVFQARRRSPRQADMMTSSAFGSGMAMGVMAWPSRKRSSFLVSVASSTMAKCGARERLAICRA